MWNVELQMVSIDIVEEEMTPSRVTLALWMMVKILGSASGWGWPRKTSFHVKKPGIENPAFGPYVKPS